MCFHYSYIVSKSKAKKRFDLIEDSPFEKIYHINAFSKPLAPVIINENINSYCSMNWGLIPFWVKDINQAEEIRKVTANARAETIFEKPSFRKSVRSKRCLVPTTGFFEWRHEGKEKTPHFIRLKSEEIFTFGGIWDSWVESESGEIINTFSIITTQANELMSYVHNTKERMSLIIRKENEKDWLNAESKEEIESLLQAYETNDMIYDIVDNKNLYDWLIEFEKNKIG